MAARVPPASLLSGVGERAVSPVVAAAAGAPADLELKHAEVVGGVGIDLVVIRAGVAGEEFADEGLVSGGEARGSAVSCGVHVRRGKFLGAAAGEELPRWDVSVAVPEEGFLE